MVKITIDIGDQYQYSGAITAIEKLARANEEEDVNFDTDDIKNLSSAANECSKQVRHNVPKLDENSLEKACDETEELKKNINRLKNT